MNFDKIKEKVLTVLCLLIFQFYGAQCHYLLHMHDSYGDGWNGAYLEVTMNGIHSGDFDCSGSYTLDSTYSFAGAAMDFIFHSGSWDSEISFAILDPLGDTLFSGPAPSDLDNLIHTSNATCLPSTNCINPSGLNAGNITINSADLSWVPFGGDTLWNLNWGISGFVQGTANTINNILAPNFSLTGLLGSTSYDFYVQSICDSNTSSIWSGPYTFTTQFNTGTCGAFSIDLFDSWGDGWNGGTIDVEINGALFQTITLLNGFGPHTAYVSVDTGDVIDLIYTAGNWPEENTYDVYDHLGNLIVSQSGNNQGGPPSTYGLSACPSCSAPTSLGANNITINLANLDWVQGGSGGIAWNLEWGLNGFVIGSGNLVNNLNNNNYILSGLTDNTTYDFYVQEICSVNDSSVWSGPFSFTTVALPPSPGSCGFFSFILYDSYGDGWNGGYADIDVNGAIVQQITLQNGAGPEVFDIPVDSGDVVNVLYSPGGWPEENSYEIFDNNNNLIVSVSDTTGVGPASTYGLIACQGINNSLCGIFHIELYDAFGNGWNNGFLTIEINNIIHNSVTLSSGFGPESSTFAIDSGDVINLVYHPPVPHSQDSYLDGYRLKDNSGNIIVEEIGLDSIGPVSSYGIEPCPTFTYVNNSTLEGFLKIYPNPAKDLINIKTDLKVNYFTISSLLGELVISRKQYLKNIDISNLPPNIYFIRFFIGDQQIIKKLVVN